MDYIEFGTTPCDEDCAQVGQEDYYERAKSEYKRLVTGIRRYFGEEPYGVFFRCSSCSHDFGSYYETRIMFDENEEEAVDYAYNVEENLPSTWEVLENGKWEG